MRKTSRWRGHRTQIRACSHRRLRPSRRRGIRSASCSSDQARASASCRAPTTTRTARSLPPLHRHRTRRVSGLHQPIWLGLDAIWPAVRRRRNLRRRFAVSVRLLSRGRLVVGRRTVGLGLGRLSLLRRLGAVSLRLVQGSVSFRLRMGTLPRRLSARLLLRRIRARRRRGPCNPAHRRPIRSQTLRLFRRDSHPGHGEDLRRRTNSQPLVSFQQPNRLERRSRRISSSRERRGARRRRRWP
jgi:hypothetical protein